MPDQQRTVLRNAFNKETFVFIGPTDDPEVARFEAILEKGGSGGGNALVHIHPYAEERFTVTSGRIRIVVEGKEQHIGPGDSAVVPRGKRHYFANDWDGTSAFVVEFRPAQRHLLFFANFARITEQHPEWFSAKGDPHFLMIAAALNIFRDHLYLAGPPIFLQKLMFAVLAPVARLLGYRFDVKPVHPEDAG